MAKTKNREERDTRLPASDGAAHRTAPKGVPPKVGRFLAHHAHELRYEFGRRGTRARGGSRLSLKQLSERAKHASDVRGEKRGQRPPRP